MRVVIDGHALGLQEGTGITTYARNLSKHLGELGYEVYPIYSMKLPRRSRQVRQASFFQRLANEGEQASGSYRAWMSQVGRNLIGFLPLLGSRATWIPWNVDLALGPMRERLPVATGYLNAPAVYRAAQAIASLLRAEVALAMPREIGHVDVFHATLPLPVRVAKARKIVTVHDVIPLKVPSATNVNLVHYRNILDASLRRVDAIFTVSEHTKKDLVEILRVPEEKIFVTYQSAEIPEHLLSMADEEVDVLLRRFSLKRRKYFIFYGAIEPKKNVANLIRAFYAAKTDCKLVIAGKNGWLFDDVERMLQNRKLARDIVRVQYLPFDVLVALLRGARALIFPSIYEGFGLPVLEAMHVGTPVITSNVSSLPEIGGEAAFYVDPYSVTSIKSAIDTFSQYDDMTLDEISVAGVRQAEKFSGENYRNRLAEGYRLVQ